MASPEASAAPPRLLVPVLVVGVLIGVFVVLAWPAPGSGGGTRPEAAPVAIPVAVPAAGTPSVPARVEARAAAVLGGGGRGRAAAWAAGDAESLAALYAPGAAAGVTDLAMLADWAGRGLTVRDLTTQLLGVQVLAHGSRRWVLHVRDRVAGAVATGAGLSEALAPGTE